MMVICTEQWDEQELFSRCMKSSVREKSLCRDKFESLDLDGVGSLIETFGDDDRFYDSIIGGVGLWFMGKWLVENGRV